MRRRILILMVALVLAGLSGVAVVAYGRGADRRALEGQQGTWVLLATARIPAGTTGAEIRSRKLVRQVLMPARTVPSGALVRMENGLDGLELNTELHPDQMLLRRQFEDAAPTAPSPAPTFSLPAGKIAVSVELSTGRQVAGNVDPGAVVKVFHTYPRQETVGRRQTTDVVIDRARVISVGERAPVASPTPAVSVAPSTGAEVAPTVLPADPAGGEILLRYVVTLAVTQSEATRLINGYNDGYLHLGLVSAPAPAPSKAGPAS
ncbi:RcpC/CpaB family pilus assembly protein [Paractinoplanes rishiriensis]|uniref:Flp pilus assembly protein RcpC/CpaB domain-containing protein n=1 Tax=Paractinoplanes rishiriensis TaxID=1050105 RepID=A0A919N223_9ACTN|nr:RcpC/CpaB family pilus assembly protein [Actinoplanes rishiriensis]GIE98422.1 hypothetical protein Ari01nite_58870 [Actinoplanes rishiriensis]